MIGEAIDTMVGWVAPHAARKRAAQRAALSAIKQRSYDAAARNRLSNHRNPSNRSADLELRQAADVRAWARDLARNNPYARGIIEARVANVVGCGITPQAMVANASGDKLAEKTNQALDRLWADWQKRADLTGRRTFYEMQALVESEAFEAGEALLQMHVDPDDKSRSVPLALELIESDRLLSDTDTIFRRISRADVAEGNTLRHGVELNPLGRPVAYHVWKQPPNDLINFRLEVERLDAEHTLHIYRQLRIGQTRGLSAFAPIVGWLRDLGYYVDNELTASAVAACFALAIKSDSDVDLPAAPSGTDSSDTDGNEMTDLQPGAIAHLRPGESVEQINPLRPNNTAGDWLRFLLRGIGTGAGMDYARVARDYTQGNFNNQRASDLEDRRRFRPAQKFLVAHLCQPVWNRFVRMAVIRGVVPGVSTRAYNDNPERFHAVKWQPPGWEFVNPKQEAEAAKIGLDESFTTLDDIATSQGKHWREVIQQKLREEQYEAEQREAMGLPARVSEPLGPGGNEADDDE